MRTIAVFFLLFVSIGANCQDFAHFQWGESFETVKGKFDPEKTQDGWTMPYQIPFIMTNSETDPLSFNGLNSRNVYHFLDNRFEGLRVFINEEHEDLNQYLDDYNKVSSFLTEKYKLVERREFWDDETYKNDPEKKAYAISQGHYNISTTYTDGESRIVHIIRQFGGSIPIYQIVDYRSKVFLEFDEENPPNYSLLRLNK